jgi:hypothetical protein
VATTPNSAITVQTPKVGLVQIANADASNLKTVVTAGANGSKVSSLVVSSSDTSSRDVQWGRSRSTVFYPIATVTIPATAGQVAGTAPIDLFSPANAPGLPVDNDGQPYIFLESGDTLDIKALTTVTTAKAISASSNYGNF